MSALPIERRRVLFNPPSRTGSDQCLDNNDRIPATTANRKLTATTSGFLCAPASRVHRQHREQSAGIHITAHSCPPLLVLLLGASSEERSSIANSGLLTATLHVEDDWQGVATVRRHGKSVASYVHCHHRLLRRCHQLHVDMVN